MAIVKLFHNLVLRANECKFIYIGLFYSSWIFLFYFFFTFVFPGRSWMCTYICTENGVMTFQMIGSDYDSAAVALAGDNDDT